MMNSARRALTTIRQLLRDYGYEERSRFVKQLIDNNVSDDFWAELFGPEFWGGSGAVWEVEPFRYSRPDLPASDADYRRFQVLMIDLADMLGSKGLSELASDRAHYFRRRLG